jgi:hypothetical protein
MTRTELIMGVLLISALLGTAVVVWHQGWW